MVLQLVIFYIVGIITFLLVLFLLGITIKKTKFIYYSTIISIYLITLLGNKRVREHGIGKIFDFIPPGFSYIVDVLFFSLLIYTFLKILLHRTNQKPLLYDYLIGALVLLFFMSALINGLQPFGIIASFRILFYFIGMYFIIHYNNFIEKYQKPVFNTLLIMSIIQFPVILFQKFIGQDLLGISSDMTCGLFTRYPKLVYFQAIFISLGMIAFFKKENFTIKLRSKMKFVALMGLGSLVFSNSRAFFFLIILIFILLLFRYIWKNPILISIRAVPGFLIIAYSLYIFLEYYGSGFAGFEVFTSLTNIDYIITYLFAGEGQELASHDAKLTRGGVFIYIFYLLKDNPISFLVGLGPSALSRFKVSVSEITTSISGLSQSHLSTYFGEMGIVSVAILLIMIFIPIYHQKKLKGYHSVNELDILIRMFVPFFIVINLFIIFYARGFLELESSFLFWFINLSIIHYSSENAKTEINSLANEQYTKNNKNTFIFDKNIRG